MAPSAAHAIAEVTGMAPVLPPAAWRGPASARRPSAWSPPLRDAATVRALLSGDEAAFTALVERHHARLLRLARFLLRGSASAEEVVQETWIDVLEGLARFEGRCSLRSWIFRILANRARTRRARERRVVPFSSLERARDDGPAVDPSLFDEAGSWREPPARWDDSPEDLLSRAELRSALEDALATLPPMQRAVVTLHDVDGLDGEETCAALDITPANQRVLLHRGRTKLRAALDAHLAVG